MASLADKDFDDTYSAYQFMMGWNELIRQDERYAHILKRTRFKHMEKELREESKLCSKHSHRPSKFPLRSKRPYLP